MKKPLGEEIILVLAASILLISIALMAIILPGVYTKTLANEYNTGAAIGISLAITFRLLLFFWYISTIKKVRRNIKKSKTSYIVIGVLLIIFGLFYLDGAVAFLDKKNILYVSYLMFTSVFFDLVASILTFTAALFKTQKINYAG